MNQVQILNKVVGINFILINLEKAWNKLGKIAENLVKVELNFAIKTQG